MIHYFCKKVHIQKQKCHRLYSGNAAAMGKRDIKQCDFAEKVIHKKKDNTNFVFPFFRDIM